MRALATVRPTSRRRRRTSARSESSSAREIVTISDASALTCYSPRLDAAPPSLSCAWSVPRQPALWCLCHIRAMNDSIRRSAAVAHGHSPAVYLAPCCRSSTTGQGDRSSKLVMRFRLPSPALRHPFFSLSALINSAGARPATDSATVSWPGSVLRVVLGLKHAPQLSSKRDL
jgi:hypothetical protein